MTELNISRHPHVEISLAIDRSEHVQWGYDFIKIVPRKCVAVYLVTWVYGECVGLISNGTGYSDLK
jgi:hypothetical protein